MPGETRTLSDGYDAEREIEYAEKYEAEREEMINEKWMSQKTLSGK